MAETKPFASLSSGLLARKGAAKPAMRPQGFGSFGASLEDLGWNDMGDADPNPHVPSSIDALTPAPGGRAAIVAEVAAEPAPEPVEPPPVVEQQRELRSRIEAPAAVEPDGIEPEPVAPEPVELEPVKPAPVERAPLASAEVVRLPRSRTAPGRGKAAFTLRLDPERHLKLRLACALTGRSAQMLVTEALDEFLASQPGLEALAERLPAEAGQRKR